MSPASLVLPHLLPHHPCLDFRTLCLLPLCPTKGPLPRYLHLLWRWLKPQCGAMKLSLKMENNVLGAFSPPQARSTSLPWRKHVQGILSSCQEVPQHLALWDLPPLLNHLLHSHMRMTPVFSVLGPPMFKWLEKNFNWARLIHPGWGPVFPFHPVQQISTSLMRILVAEEVACFLYAGSQAGIFHPVVDYFPISYTWLFSAFLFQ